MSHDMGKIAAKTGGFSSLQEYGHFSDVTWRLGKIKKPFFFLSSLDDMFFGPQCIPIDHCHDNIMLGVTKSGGHCNYMEGSMLPNSQWWTKPTVEFLEYFFKN